MKSALVTGAYGFVGRHVARAIAASGYYVKGIGHGSWNRSDWRVWGISEWHASDVTVEALMVYAGEPEIIFHCAGGASVGFSMTHPYQDYLRTVTSTMAVLEFVRLNAPGAAVVFPSSAGVYGTVAQMPIRISDTCKPVSPYGLHKKLAEDLCRSYASHFNVRLAIVRLFSIYGIGIRKQLLWDACMKIADGDLEFRGTGLETRDWLHITDAANLLIAAASRASAACPVVNGGSGISIEVREILNHIAMRLGRRDRPYFSGELRGGDPVHYQADIAQAISWGWAPTRMWHDEVQAYVDWFKDGAL